MPRNYVFQSIIYATFLQYPLSENKILHMKIFILYTSLLLSAFTVAAQQKLQEINPILHDERLVITRKI